MMLKVTALLGLLFDLVAAKSAEHYCALNREHKMCQFRKLNSMGLRCWDISATPESILKEVMLEKHNSLRNDYVGYSKGGFAVPNMLGLKWDWELAEIARRWAMQCPYYEDEFRDVDRFKVAQTVAIHTAHDPEQRTSLSEVWDSIKSGNQTFHKRPEGPHGRLQNTLECSFRLDIPLTLITNPYFEYVGCAASSYKQVVDGKGANRTILVCNYGPLYDSYDSSQPAGLPCTRCPVGTNCFPYSAYPNLCFDLIE